MTRFTEGQWPQEPMEEYATVESEFLNPQVDLNKGLGEASSIEDLCIY